MSQPPPAPIPDPVGTLVRSLRAASPRGTKLSKEQKQFNKLVADVDALRSRLAQWREFVPELQSRVAAEIDPLVARYRERRIELVMLLSKAIDGPELSKRQKTKAIEILHWHLSEILEAEPDEDLIALYDKYAQTSFEQEQVAEADFLRDMASDVFGLDLGEDEQGDGLNADDLAHLIAEKLEAEQQAQHQYRTAGRKKSAKAQANEDLRQQLAQGASQAVREIYRKLASDLHPDREPDEEQRLRKTALMQQANEAYANSDLLSLLALQLHTAQLDTATLGGLARERLLQYNHLLTEQCQQLRAELDQLVAPFAMNMAGGRGDISPDAILRGLEREARDLKRAAKDCEADVAHYRDIRNIKDSLNAYRLGQLGQDYGSPLDEVFFEDLPPPRRRRR